MYDPHVLSLSFCCIKKACCTGVKVSTIMPGIRSAVAYLDVREM